jgi:two-component system cell cycle response regulator DivK
MSKRILVVEDQEDNRQIIRDLLSATDYEIIEAESGEQANSRISIPACRR